MNGARTSLTGWLARMGFADVSRAERELTALGIAATGAADPDTALAGLSQVAERDPDLIQALADDHAFATRLITVLGVSKAMAEHLTRHPGDTALLRGPDAAIRPDAKAVR
ncbi:MAG TPA: bifunctional glutamine-synthetase adenylyltransferase/deadenyltransferase, partial [Trebonia sp.]|nr:bifunctional glutamine-synthetase adenylyltransferase/deadenyltransferase [Trebonia sp.]